MASTDISLGKAIDAFVEGQSVPYGVRSELSRFAMLCGKDCPMFTLSYTEAREFVMELTKPSERKKRVEALDEFFSYSKEKGWIRINPADGVIPKKEPRLKPMVAHPAKPSKRGALHLSEDGRDQIEAEISALQAEKTRVIAEVKAAREEGDLKENAGYHAARERLGLIEGQLKEKADILSRAVTPD